MRWIGQLGRLVSESGIGRTLRLSLLTVVLGGCAFSAGVAQRLIWLGTLGGDQSSASGVSANGAVVVGTARNASGQARAFRWTIDEGMRDLGTLGGAESEALGVSADGNVIVGSAHNAQQYRLPFRWTPAGGDALAGELPNAQRRSDRCLRRWHRGGRLDAGHLFFFGGGISLDCIGRHSMAWDTGWSVQLCQRCFR